MLGVPKLVLIACTVLFASSNAIFLRRDDVSAAQVLHDGTRGAFYVPSLAQIRDILANLEAPIIGALTERYRMASDPSLYAGSGALLKEYLMAREASAKPRGRYVYGSLEYPYTFTAVQPDKTSISNAFPPGRFHQDTYVGNPDLFKFYTNTLAPLFNSTQSFFFHLDDSICERDAALNLDVAILALLSHRASIGKIVAESKYAADPNNYTPLIRAQDSAQIRVLLTNTTQEAAVLAQAATAASAFAMAWTSSEATPSETLSSDLANIASTVFRDLIDVTTNVEVEYLLQRFH